jgi:hypothetical protein
MSKRYAIVIILVLALAGKLLAFTPPPEKYENRKYGFSYAGSLGYSFFKVDKRHSQPASSLLGLGGIFRFHFFVRPNVHLHLGLEVLSQKGKFNTYYFADGHSQLYDQSYGYTHRMRTYELYVPLMIRIGTNMQEANAPAIFYFLGGYSPKIFLSASTLVTEDATGEEIWGGSTELEFENWFINEQTGNVLMIGMGLDKRFGWTNKFMSFELIYRYNLSRFIYRGNYNSNELLIKNSCLTLQVGYRFQ